MNEEYESAQFVPMSDFEMENNNGGGIIVVVFILVAAVTVAEGLFIYGGVVAWTAAVGTSFAIAAEQVTNN